MAIQSHLARTKRPRLPVSPSSWLPTASHAFTIRYQSTVHSTGLATPPERTLAVIGGGLSGLATAHYYLRSLSPALKAKTRVVILEKQHRVGGWCRAVRIQDGKRLQDGQQPDPNAKDLLVFETGPRSIRPLGLLGWLTIEMAHDVGLSSQLVIVPKSAPSAKNRYLYTPPTLTLLPSSLSSAFKSLFTVPLIRHVLPSILLEPFRPRSPLHDDPSGLGDESVDAFFTRRFGKTLASEMMSAMIHGIYAGDTRRLSVRAAFPQLWEAEREWGSVVLAGLFGSLARRKGWKEKSAWRRRAEEETDEMEMIKMRLSGLHQEGGHRLVKAMEGASVWGVKGGIETLTDRLRARLEREGVEFWMGERGAVNAVEKVDGAWRVTTATDALDATQVVTTIPQILPSELDPPIMPSTTVSVINLSFPSPPPGAPPLFPRGFGYLIPRTVSESQNPHQVLGVLFDTDVQPEVDSSIEQGLVKVSVLLGGSYWLDRVPPPSPPHEDLVRAALETLRLHFPGTSFPAPVHAFSHTHQNCIPQVPPNSLSAFRAFGERLRKEGNGSLAVVGGGFSAVGVNGCVKSAWEVGTAMAELRNGEVGRQEAGKAVARTVKTGTEMWEL
ncbi:hypothetical protein JCM10908_000513 [Rhodotorula pacifica]|uniref:oxygen-dependent protoporphyrinogen oxidase n=1 Tax=Rhodotorula pacifica TaxID=1495444 RepID=UPI003170923E